MEPSVDFATVNQKKFFYWEEGCMMLEPPLQGSPAAQESWSGLPAAVLSSGWVWERLQKEHIGFHWKKLTEPQFAYKKINFTIIVFHAIVIWTG